MVSAAELRTELKALRKEHPDHLPASKMKKHDISDLIQRLKAGREETPNVSATAALAPKTSVETISHAKEDSMPTKHKVHKKAAEMPKAATKKAEMPKAATKKAEMPKAAKAEMPKAKGRHPKGSAEAKAHMAAIRSKKGSSKKDE